MADQVCKYCYYHNLDGQGGCTAKGNRIHPHVWEKCAYKPSMWKPKAEPKGGRKVIPYEVDPSPRQGILPGKPVKHGVLSLAVFGQGKAYVDAEGNAYSADEEKRPLGKIEDLQLDAELSSYGFTREIVSPEFLELLTEQPNIIQEDF